MPALAPLEVLNNVRRCVLRSERYEHVHVVGHDLHLLDGDPGDLSHMAEDPLHLADEGRSREDLSPVLRDPDEVEVEAVDVPSLVAGALYPVYVSPHTYPYFHIYDIQRKVENSPIMRYNEYMEGGRRPT